MKSSVNAHSRFDSCLHTGSNAVRVPRKTSLRGTVASVFILALVEQTGACGYIVNSEGTRVINYFQRKQT